MCPNTRYGNGQWRTVEARETLVLAASSSLAAVVAMERKKYGVIVVIDKVSERLIKIELQVSL
jgi:hypothetical protein